MPTPSTCQHHRIFATCPQSASLLRGVPGLLAPRALQRLVRRSNNGFGTIGTLRACVRVAVVSNRLRVSSRRPDSPAPRGRRPIETRRTIGHALARARLKCRLCRSRAPDPMRWPNPYPVIRTVVVVAGLNSNQR